MPEPSQIAIFFSYAWGDNNETGTSREQIVNALYESLLKDGYAVIRDKADLGYKGIISDFMKEIGRGKYIVVVISDKYLKSPNCMFELLQIYQKSNSEVSEMKYKIFPVILSDAKIYDPIERANYSAYWIAKKEELNEKIKQIGLDYSAGIVNDYQIYNEITSNIDRLTSFLKDMNTLNAQELSQDDFAEIKTAIEKLVTNNHSTAADQPAAPVAPTSAPKSYNLGKMRKFFENGLSDADLNNLCMDNFEEVYNQFTDGLNKSIKINLLLDYCKRRLSLDKLLQAMEDANSQQFEYYKPYAN